jgi:hypothetical protein
VTRSPQSDVDLIGPEVSDVSDVSDVSEVSEVSEMSAAVRRCPTTEDPPRTRCVLDELA